MSIAHPRHALVSWPTRVTVSRGFLAKTTATVVFGVTRYRHLFYADIPELGHRGWQLAQLIETQIRACQLLDRMLESRVFDRERALAIRERLECQRERWWRCWTWHGQCRSGSTAPAEATCRPDDWPDRKAG